MEQSQLSDNHTLVREAADALRLRDIFLYECNMLRPVPFPEDATTPIEQLGRSGVKVARDEISGEDGTPTAIIQFTVDMGLRLVGPTAAATPDAESEAPIYLQIEATYLVEYQITNSDVSDDALKAFAHFNAIHNVWPFWRQHIFDLRQRGGLPKIEVPLFAGTKL